MSQSESITTVFDLQRTAIEQSQEALHRTVDLQTRTAELFLDGLERAVESSDADAAGTAVDAYFDAVEAGVPGDAEGVAQLRETVHEQLEAAQAANADALENLQALSEENLAAYEEFADAYVEAVDDSVDAALAAHEQVEEQSVTVAEQVEAQFEEFDAAEAVSVPIDDE